MCYSPFSLYSFSEKEMQFSYARVFAEKGKENNGRAYYETFFLRRALPYKYHTVFGTKPPDIRPILQNGRFLAVRSYPDEMKTDRLSIRLFPISLLFYL